MNAFQEATKDCQRDDCSLSAIGGVVTCLAWTPTYDKNGARTDRGDPNIHSSRLVCSTCGRRWSVQTQYGETTVTLDGP